MNRVYEVPADYDGPGNRKMPSKKTPATQGIKDKIQEGGEEW